MACRLLYCVDHPIQYQAPLLRLIARQPGIDLRVVFKSSAGATRYFDPGFGTSLQWDTPLLEGYAFDVIEDDRTACAAIHDADVVWLHGWQGPRMWRLLRTTHRLGIPVLMRGENTLTAMPDGSGLRGMLKRRYLNWIFARCTAFLAIGSANRAFYLAHGVEPDRLFDMPYAVDNAYFRMADPAGAEAEALRSRLDLEKGRPVILFAGKFQARKHPLALLEAFLSLDADRLGRPYLVFVGGGEQGADLKTAAAGHPSIRFAGFLNQGEMREVYGLADVFVLASSREPWGLAVNEAMNGRCAVVVSDECGCAADLVDTDSGRIVPPGDANALASSLDDILVDPERCRAMGLAASQRIDGWNFERDIAGLDAAIRFARQGRQPA